MNPAAPADSPDVFVPFVKMQGIGNDFAVLDLLREPSLESLDFPRMAQEMCKRHLGVGSDGLLSLQPSTDGHDIRMRMWNPDGSEDMCGNGLRCIAHLAHARGYVGESFRVQTLAGTRDAQIGGPNSVRVSMGAPDFVPQNVPIAQAEPLIEGRIELDGRVFQHVTSLSTGSTHTVIFGDSPVDEATFTAWSPRLEVADLFPQRTSIMWARSLGSNRFGVRIWERGAGETLACGTGACAVAVAALSTGRADGPVEVRSRGGELRIEWDKARNQIWKTGPVAEVFQGVWRW